MTTKINKSEVMKRAWAIFRMSNGYSFSTKKFTRMIKSFSYCLKNAWLQIKLSVIPETSIDGVSAYYRENTRYYGD